MGKLCPSYTSPYVSNPPKPDFWSQISVSLLQRFLIARPLQAIIDWFSVHYGNGAIEFVGLDRIRHCKKEVMISTFSQFWEAAVSMKCFARHFLSLRIWGLMAGTFPCCVISHWQRTVCVLILKPSSPEGAIGTYLSPKGSWILILWVACPAQQPPDYCVIQWSHNYPIFAIQLVKPTVLFTSSCTSNGCTTLKSELLETLHV